MPKIFNYSKKRHLFFAIVFVFAIVLPFLQINGNHFFLLSFDRKELHLFFTFFPAQSLHFMTFMLIMLFVFVFFITTLLGRVWCGWACPQTIFRTIYRDFIQTKLLGLFKNTKNRQNAPQKSIFKKLLAVTIFACIAFLATANLLWYFIPPEDFFEYIKNPSEHMLLFGIWGIFTAFFVFDVVYLQEKFCIFICPYARVQSVMFDSDTVQVIYDDIRGGKIYDERKNLISHKPAVGDCIGCENCVKICPTHIDIRKGMQLECINCLDCADACSNVMAKFGKESLVRWTSRNSVDTGKGVQYFRFRTIGYIVVLCIVAIAFSLFSTKKTDMLLNIDRTSELFQIKIHNENTEILNAYSFLFENLDGKEHKFEFKIDNEAIAIKKPKEQIKVKGKGKKKIIVILKAKENLNNSESQNLFVPIVIKANAVDKPDIKVETKTIFVYPSLNDIRKKLEKHKKH